MTLIQTTIYAQKIAVTGVSLDKSSISLTTAGQTEQLTATVTPPYATNKDVTWSSSNTSIATVDNTGLVTCVTPGTATITVTTDDGGFTDTCSISQGRTPGANTIAYYPLTSTTTINDMKGSGTAYNLTQQGTVSFVDNYASFNASGRLDTPITETPANQTISFWLNQTTRTSGEQVPLAKWGSSSTYCRWGFYINNSGVLNARLDDNYGWDSILTLTQGDWYLITYTRTGGGTASCSQNVYVNGVLNKTKTAPLYASAGYPIKMGGRTNTYNYRGKLSDVIIENRQWSVNDVKTYYNQTCSDYGLSPIS